jgi:hypothetical protein
MMVPCLDYNKPFQVTDSNATEWWQFLDWSTMKQTWTRMPKELKLLVYEKGFWSKGKGVFEK